MAKVTVNDNPQSTGFSVRLEQQADAVDKAVAGQLFTKAPLRLRSALRSIATQIAVMVTSILPRVALEYGQI
jgi:hypothetical protein